MLYRIIRTVLASLIFIPAIGFTQLAGAQTVQRLDDGDVLYGKIKQVKETYHWVLPKGQFIPHSTGDTIKVLVYNFDADGKLIEFKAYFPEPLAKGLKLFDDYQYKYEADTDGSPVFSGYSADVLISKGKLNAEGKLIAVAYYDKKGRVTGRVTQTFADNNTEGTYARFDPKGKLLFNRKTTYSADGQLMAVRYYDIKNNSTLALEFNVAPDRGLNWSKRVCDVTSGKRKDKHLIEREYVYYP